mmetsp:Transcript_2898/g.4984  ORF Transcript_2898/g.4984 Transcript_2898/m.4984 type:complete len:206 (-) Transcript_2898:147-764(-)|eukprot:CAMPEP_0116562214 /NCGR_PEP_ID=MMETSP0397-20121206/12033_1 /TAXON_ID=216820 /ORGANISM="Cyclophora tenuis, Strain ECT3854" /LENGTH=205 /DNA_ID=CAMNT_0004088481 /DNA_START=40 /DNA_END=657 /DNA_ORIENTATION=+
MSTYQNTAVTNYGGDVNVRPNTGQANATFFGSDMKEMRYRMRVCHLITCTVALLLLIPSIMGQLSGLHPARGVLALYLGLFCGLLCCYEIRNKRIDMTISDSFGFLYNPIGRACFLLMMGGLAVGERGLNIILGIVFFFNAFWMFFMYCRYKEFREWTRPGEEEDLLKRAQESAKEYAWANPNIVGAAAGAALGGPASEQQSLKG